MNFFLLSLITIGYVFLTGEFLIAFYKNNFELENIVSLTIIEIKKTLKYIQKILQNIKRKIEKSKTSMDNEESIEEEEVSSNKKEDVINNKNSKLKIKKKNVPKDNNKEQKEKLDNGNQESEEENNKKDVEEDVLIEPMDNIPIDVFFRPENKMTKKEKEVKNQVEKILQTQYIIDGGKKKLVIPLESTQFLTKDLNPIVTEDGNINISIKDRKFSEKLEYMQYEIRNEDVIIDLTDEELEEMAEQIEIIQKIVNKKLSRAEKRKLKEKKKELVDSKTEENNSIENNQEVENTEQNKETENMKSINNTNNQNNEQKQEKTKSIDSDYESTSKPIKHKSKSNLNFSIPSKLEEQNSNLQNNDSQEKNAEVESKNDGKNNNSEQTNKKTNNDKAKSIDTFNDEANKTSVNKSNNNITSNESLDNQTEYNPADDIVNNAGDIVEKVSQNNVEKANEEIEGLTNKKDFSNINIQKFYKDILKVAESTEKPFIVSENIIKNLEILQKKENINKFLNNLAKTKNLIYTGNKEDLFADWKNIYLAFSLLYGAEASNVLKLLMEANKTEINKSFTYLLSDEINNEHYTNKEDFCSVLLEHKGDNSHKVRGYGSFFNLKSFKYAFDSEQKIDFFKSFPYTSNYKIVKIAAGPSKFEETGNGKIPLLVTSKDIKNLLIQ